MQWLSSLHSEQGLSSTWVKEFYKDQMDPRAVLTLKALDFET